jgi:hypothetical protein
MVQDTGFNRNMIDKFYTSASTVDLCMKLFNAKVLPDSDDLIIEPSAGNGAFVSHIKQMTSNHLFYDLQPEHPEIIQYDYMQFESALFEQRFERIHVLGNPPYGHRCSSAIKFIKKSARFCNTISFILPRSFKKEYYKKSVPLNFHLILEVDLPKNSFLVNNEAYDVPCVFQIWERRATCRHVEKLTPNGFEFVKKTENPDISFRRKGWKEVGLIEKNLSEKESSSYYIRFTNGLSVDENIQKLDGITFDHNNVITSRSIARSELIAKFNSRLPLPEANVSSPR